MYILSFICLGVANKLDGQCSEAFDKSAVTPEAAKEAAKVISSPPPAHNENVYSSKVKSMLSKVAFQMNSS